MPISQKIKRKISVLLFLFTALCTGIFVSFAPSFAGRDANSASESEQVSALFQEYLRRGRIGDSHLGRADEIRAFYVAQNGTPLWLGSGAPRRRTRQFVEVIEKSWTHALNPARYHLQEIKDRLGEDDPALQAELELFLTDAAVKYAQDMLGQRLRGIKLPDELSGFRPPVAPMEILRMLAAEDDARTLFASMEPESATYKRLREAFVELSSEGEEDYVQYLPLDFGRVILRPGVRHPNMPSLRARLNARQQTPDPTLYDDALFGAVTKFQRAEGMKDDGIIGLDTLAALNRTNRQRLNQLRANMERLRWMEGRERPEKFIVVNIPAATLWAIDDGDVEFEMEVIVGRSERPTPAIVTDITGIRFNPDWTVPPTIKKEDIVPKLREDPNYLANKGIELTYHGENGLETIDPSSIDWNTIGPRDLSALNMVQVSGDHNPLGRIRVLMPNRHSIYLHDTNQREYFDKYARALSSGCIRMKEPMKVAEFIMSGEPGWNTEKINTVIAQGRTTDRLITHRIPVYILYYTVWIDDQGRLVFGRDIYGRDKGLIRALDKLDGGV